MYEQAIVSKMYENLHIATKELCAWLEKCSCVWEKTGGRYA